MKLDLEKLLLHEEILWHSKYRESWLTCKDLNTTYFHLSTLIRRRSNDVNFLKLDSGIWVSSRADIGSNFSDHFTNHFSSSNPTIEVEMLDHFTQVITEEDNFAICAIPTEIEVVQTLASLGSQKAPSPEGYAAFFLKKYGDIVKDDVLNFVWNFFRNNHLSRELNHTFLALIPKTSGSHYAHQFRPISLCNIAYKIVSNILANGLKPLLHKIISPINLLSFQTKTRTTLFWPMKSSILSKTRKEKVDFFSLKWTWRRPLTEWSDVFLLLSWKKLASAPLG